MNSKILVIRASMVEKKSSISNEMVDKFIEIYKSVKPNDTFIELDLNNEPMAQISLNRNNAATFFNEKDSDKYIDMLKNVDKVIFACPMTNFNICATAKNYLDHILVANKTFSYKYSKKGDAIGLLPHLSVQLLTTQGAPLGWYPWGNHTENLKGTWEFMGAKVNKPVLIAGNKIAENSSKTPSQRVQESIKELTEAAKLFANIPFKQYVPVQLKK